MNERCPYTGCGRTLHRDWHVPKTRKELLHYLWMRGWSGIDIYRCGPQYVIQILGVRRAVQGGGGIGTKCRSIQLLNNEEWHREFVSLNKNLIHEGKPHVEPHA